MSQGPSQYTPDGPWCGTRRFLCELRSSGRNGAWLCVGGELDLAHAPVLNEALDSAFSAETLIVLDLRGLTFVDVAGLGAIVKAESRAADLSARLVLVLQRGCVQVDRLFAFASLRERVEILEFPLSEG